MSSWDRNVLRSLAGFVVLGGLAAGSIASAHADPTTSPSPAPTQSAPATAAAPATGAAAATATAPTAGVTTSGGAATSASGGAATSATGGAATSASGGAATPNTAANTGATAGGDVLDQLAQEYAIGSGGGQLSNLLKTSIKLRSMGFKPSKQYLDEIQTAMNYRPNQNPLIGALKDTIAYQQKIKAQMDILQQAQSKNANSAVMGAGQMPADSSPSQFGAAMGQPPGPAAAAPAPPVMMPAPAEAPTP